LPPKISVVSAAVSSLRWRGGPVGRVGIGDAAGASREKHVKIRVFAVWIA
jgi:hypothetical protein